MFIDATILTGTAEKPLTRYAGEKLPRDSRKAMHCTGDAVG